MIDCQCLWCGSAFRLSRYDVERGGGKHCSRACYIKHAHASRGTVGAAELAAKMLPLISFEPNSGCWLWEGRVNKDGYGLVKHRTKQWLTHRAALAITGTLRADKVVMHTCDVRCCVNPDHLRQGTPAENTHDMVRKGRHARGPAISLPRWGTRSRYAVAEAPP